MHSDSFQYAKQRKGAEVYVLLVVYLAANRQKKRPVFLPRTSVILFSSRRVLAELNLIHVNALVA